jgi:alpha-beta hydrolase superfamily lysophospholipase
MRVERHVVPSRGARVVLTRYLWRATRPSADAHHPVLVVPGYGMNSNIFSFHPEGISLVEALAREGLDPWTVDLRGQGGARNVEAAYGLAELAWDDLPAALAHVSKVTHAERVHLIGCSLGAAISFTYLSRFGASAPVGSMVSMAGLVTWREIHPLVRTAFLSPTLASWVPTRGTKHAAALALPILRSFGRSLLSLYLNPDTTDLTHQAKMLETVEDPARHLNREIGEWLRRRELVVGGINVSRSLAAYRKPLLCVVAAHDGIVPPATSRAIYEDVGSEDRELLMVGEDDHRVAHADLFLGKRMFDLAFQPIARFLATRSGPPSSSS